ncbi:pleckstrin homology domain-containing family M member 1 [Lutzomyia longipalpis]|uniref:pleckstrin homology domain-containing family M member 1 n=1 Tax=Lutzomyia longipalpis TaxID=7200 RepID=UPI0024845DA7|nr:pleckstrin homology domain-containing family M member 1 [Lutzomyia longipalpis]
MESFFSGVRSSLSGRETIIKQSLISALSENAREIQFEYAENNCELLELTESTNSFCTTIEAIFLHGIKGSFVRKTISVIANEINRRPEPSFWPILLIFSHKQFIDQIQSLTQVSKEIGYCRAWIRLLINDGLLSSHLKTIRNDSSALNPYYNRHALLKDNDRLEVAERILEGIEACIRFNLPYNSSLLNQWTDQPLQMAGIWAPPLKSYPIASGVDVASSLSDDVPIELPPQPKPLSIDQVYEDSISNSMFSTSPLNQPRAADLSSEENFDILMQKVSADDEIVAERTKERKRSGGGNSLDQREGWSSPTDQKETQQQKEPPKILSRSNSMTQSIVSTQSTSADRQSFNTLLAKHADRNTYATTFDLSNIWDQLEAQYAANVNRTPTEKTPSQNESDEDLSFEMIDSLTEKFNLDELRTFIAQTCTLAREQGLDRQGFMCQGCSSPFGIGVTPPQVCSFSGHYFCDACMSQDLHVIPAKVIHNWDFRRFPVSQKASKFLFEFQQQPIIDMKIVNSDIYGAVSEMAELQSLRIQLNFIRAYLFTCNREMMNKFQEQVCGKTYLYEHIHRYSIGDITQQIPKGSLKQLLRKAIQFGQEHILNCRLCSQRGFICEICRSQKVLYPFNIDTTFRCDVCGAVFHDTCLNALQPCPKCDRRKKREDLPLQDALESIQED